MFWSNDFFVVIYPFIHLLLHNVFVWFVSNFSIFWLSFYVYLSKFFTLSRMITRSLCCWVIRIYTCNKSWFTQVWGYQGRSLIHRTPNFDYQLHILLNQWYFLLNSAFRRERGNNSGTYGSLEEKPSSLEKFRNLPIILSLFSSISAFPAHFSVTRTFD